MSKQTKLTLRIDEDLINQAKAHAKRSGKSVSVIVADYFALLARNESANDKEKLPEIVSSLIGILKNKSVDEKDYRKYLEDKYL